MAKATVRWLACAIAAIACGFTATATLAQDLADTTPVDATIDRGLAFLAKDAIAWKTEHNCSSCHHASLVVWAMSEGKRRGHAVDEAVLADMTTWIASAGEGRTGVPRPEKIPRAFNEKAVHYSLGLESIGELDPMQQEALALLLTTVKSDQLENGSWAAWTDTRPPIFGYSDERATLMATLALLPAAATDEAATAARDKALAWLTATAPEDDPQCTAWRLVLWKRLGRTAEQLAPLIQKIRDRQRDDGGWSQTPEMASDAWATGQALYALAETGIARDDPAVARGHEFLAKTQREDGGWTMTSRPTRPGGEGSTSLIPITGGGSAWAVIGLSRSR